MQHKNKNNILISVSAVFYSATDNLLRWIFYSVKMSWLRRVSFFPAVSTVRACEDINKKAERAFLQQISWCNTVKALNWAAWFACEIILRVAATARSKGTRHRRLRISWSESTSRLLGVRLFHVHKFIKAAGNHSGANYSPLQLASLQLTLLNFSCSSVFDKSNGGCRASWITFTHVVWLCFCCLGLRTRRDIYCI